MSSPVWHPFTQHGLEPQMLPIARAEGAWLEASDGQRIFDGISSWWVITHGHRHPKIVRAIQEQADKLDQVVFAGFTHEPAETVARELIKIAPSGLAHVFFSDSGSTAVEVALKMALGYWRNIGQKRTRILALEHAYHGDTVGTMSAGARGVFNAAYAPLLFDVERIPLSSSRARTADIRRARQGLPERRHGGLHLGTVDPRRRRHADLRRRDAGRNAQDLRGARRAFHRRRSDDRLWAYGDAVCLRAGAYLTRHSLRREGYYRRLDPARRDALQRSDLCGASLRRSGAHFLSFELVHSQPHRLRGRGGQSRDLAHGAGSSSGSRPSRPLRNNACRA